MGNCCLRHQSSMHWGGDDWGSPVPDHFVSSGKRRHGDMRDTDEVITMEGDNTRLSSASSSTKAPSGTTEAKIKIKIRIRKEELEELLGSADVRKLSVQQVLAGLVNSSSSHPLDGTHPRSWRPDLDSIPE